MTAPDSRAAPRAGQGKDWQMVNAVYIYGTLRSVWYHPELGWVLDDNSGAAGPPGTNAYGAGQWPVSEQNQTLMGYCFAQERIPAVSPELASDGWHWVLASRIGTPERTRMLRTIRKILDNPDTLQFMQGIRDQDGYDLERVARSTWQTAQHQSFMRLVTPANWERIRNRALQFTDGNEAFPEEPGDDLETATIRLVVNILRSWGCET